MDNILRYLIEEIEDSQGDRFFLLCEYYQSLTEKATEALEGIEYIDYLKTIPFYSAADLSCIHKATLKKWCIEHIANIIWNDLKINLK